jgi:hypothetical protein
MTIGSIAGPHKRAVRAFYNLANGAGIQLSKIMGDIRKYAAGDLSDEVQKAIHDAAMNPTVSQDVIARTQSGISAARTKYIRLVLISSAIGICPHLAAPLLGIFTSRGYLLVSGHEIAGPGVTNAVVFCEAAAVYFLTMYFPWRRDNGLGYIASYLTRSLQCGLEHHNDPTNIEFRDRFAASIQQAATRYATIFKRSSGRPRFFAARVRSVARGCRNDILSLIPPLVTADRDEIAAINCNLARLVIRSQTGYWHQTEDIVKQGAVVPRRDTILISVLTFIKDRSVQAALILSIGALIGTIITVVLGR